MYSALPTTGYIQEGVEYLVFGTSGGVIYDGTTYAFNTRFTGVAGVTDYTLNGGDAAVTEIFKYEAVTLEGEPYQSEIVFTETYQFEAITLEGEPYQSEIVLNETYSLEAVTLEAQATADPPMSLRGVQLEFDTQSDEKLAGVNGTTSFKSTQLEYVSVNKTKAQVIPTLRTEGVILTLITTNNNSIDGAFNPIFTTTDGYTAYFPNGDVIIKGSGTQALSYTGFTDSTEKSVTILFASNTSLTEVRILTAAEKLTGVVDFSQMVAISILQVRSQVNATKIIPPKNNEDYGLTEVALDSLLSIISPLDLRETTIVSGQLLFSTSSFTKLLVSDKNNFTSLIRGINTEPISEVDLSPLGDGMPPEIDFRLTNTITLLKFPITNNIVSKLEFTPDLVNDFPGGELDLSVLSNLQGFVSFRATKYDTLKLPVNTNTFTVFYFDRNNFTNGIPEIGNLTNLTNGGACDLLLSDNNMTTVGVDQVLEDLDSNALGSIGSPIAGSIRIAGNNQPPSPAGEVFAQSLRDKGRTVITS